jgi:hypothetical protein
MLVEVGDDRGDLLAGELLDGGAQRRLLPSVGARECVTVS